VQWRIEIGEPAAADRRELAGTDDEFVRVVDVVVLFFVGFADGRRAVAHVGR
jgi:hypothetical protein